MSLGKPDLYIGGQLMQTLKTDPRPALAGLRVGWGNDSRIEFDPAAKLSGQLLIKGTMPSFLEVGAPVGLVDPVSARTLFAGMLGPLQAAPEERVKGAYRVQFTAASPLSELQQHKVTNQDWDNNTPGPTRFNTLKTTMPRGWTLNGSTGLTWVNCARQVYQSIEWLTLAQRFCRGYLYRYYDSSSYVPGAGLSKRLTFTGERHKSLGASPAAAARGSWYPNWASSVSGAASLPPNAVTLGIEWEKTPEDMITDVTVTSFPAIPPEGQDSSSYTYNMAYAGINNDALQDAYGFRQVEIETMLTAYNGTAFDEQMRNINNFWLDTQGSWRPTSLQLHDSRLLDDAPLLNLLAVDTRATAVLTVPGAVGTPGPIRSYVMAGEATWNGKKWITDLTLGRTI